MQGDSITRTIEPPLKGRLDREPAVIRTKGFPKPVRPLSPALWHVSASRRRAGRVTGRGEQEAEVKAGRVFGPIKAEPKGAEGWWS